MPPILSGDCECLWNRLEAHQRLSYEEAGWNSVEACRTIATSEVHSSVGIFSRRQVDHLVRSSAVYEGDFKEDVGAEGRWSTIWKRSTDEGGISSCAGDACEYF